MTEERVAKSEVAQPLRLERASELTAHGESLASHRDGRGAPPARRDDREYREYLSEEQRSRRGCIARRMQPDFHHGLSGPSSPHSGHDPIFRIVIPTAVAAAACRASAHTKISSDAVMRAAKSCADATWIASSVRRGCLATRVSAVASTSLVTSTKAQNARSVAKRFKISGTRSSSSVPSETRRRRALRSSTDSTADVTPS